MTVGAADDVELRADHGRTIRTRPLASKTFSMAAGFARPMQWLGGLTRSFSLERGLLGGGLLFLAGLGLEVKIVVDWWRAGAGELMAVRGIVIGMTALVMGAQTVFASFLVSLMLIERR